MVLQNEPNPVGQHDSSGVTFASINIRLSKIRRPEPVTTKTPVATVDRAAQLGIVVCVGRDGQYDPIEN